MQNNKESTEEKKIPTDRKSVRKRKLDVLQRVIIGEKRADIIAYAVSEYGISEATANDYVKEARREFRKGVAITAEEWSHWYAKDSLRAKDFLDGVSDEALLAGDYKSAAFAKFKSHIIAEKLVKRYGPNDVLANLKQSGEDKVNDLLAALEAQETGGDEPSVE